MNNGVLAPNVERIPAHRVDACEASVGVGRKGPDGSQAPWANTGSQKRLIKPAGSSTFVGENPGLSLSPWEARGGVAVFRTRYRGGCSREEDVSLKTRVQVVGIPGAAGDVSARRLCQCLSVAKIVVCSVT